MRSDPSAFRPNSTVDRAGCCSENVKSPVEFDCPPKYARNPYPLRQKKFVNTGVFGAERRPFGALMTVLTAGFQ